MHKDQVHCFKSEDKEYGYSYKKLVDLWTAIVFCLIEIRSSQLILQRVRGLGGLRRQKVWNICLGEHTC